MHTTTNAPVMSRKARRNRDDAFEALRESARHTEAAVFYAGHVPGREAERDELEKLTARLQELTDLFNPDADDSDSAG